jgi:hypothetical protein
MLNNSFIKFVIWFIVVLIFGFVVMAVCKMFGVGDVDMGNL